MDIKEQVESIINAVKKDPSKLAAIKDDPAAAVKDLLGGAVPDEAVEKVVEEVKKNLTPEKLSGIADAIGKIFKK